MIVTVNSQVLVQELRLLNKIVPTKPAIAILSHILLRADAEDGLHLFATDLELSLRTQCESRVTLPGTCAVPLAKFLALVERFNDGDVDIALEKQTIVIKCGAFTTKLQALRAEDFPTQPQAEGEAHKLNATGLRSMIERTRYAVAAGGSIQVLKGALLTLTGTVAAMAATDSHRLALVTMQREGPDAKLIIPAKTLDLLVEGEGDEVELRIGPRHLFFTIGHMQLISRMLDGDYPKYERIIPRKNDLTVTIERTSFAAALRRIAVIDEDSKAVYFSIAPGTLDLFTQNAAVGSASETLRVDYEGPALKVCMNATYVLDFIEAALNPTITLALQDALQPALLKDGNDHIGVIMLMR